MPLFIIAIIFLIGMLIYIIISIMIGKYELVPIRIKIPKIFNKMRSNVNFSVEDVDEAENNEEQE